MITQNLQYDHIITKAEPDDANFEPHFHNVYELEYIFNIEDGEFAFGHNKYTVKPDTLIVCPPMTIHNMCFLTGQEFERTVIRFIFKRRFSRHIEFRRRDIRFRPGRFYQKVILRP